ncbi:MAG TPA: bifunctional alpha,alpha-trehalose-phosphate synthase (UDP-forming)/trehalose-phosphatase [Gemmatimonadales bacterium]|nr:bifunctional alpha,alpha-trehalose-phosphate synthase (UDP-forming)/trehalose-phosphatase [Gemmatimonadales bacterium]
MTAPSLVVAPDAALQPVPGPASVPQAPAPRRLVVVSNRLPFQVERTAGEVRLERSPGGLVAALDPVLDQRGGVWIGWPGVPREETGPGGLSLPATGRVTYRQVALSGAEIAQYYAGFANRTLWPLFHYFLGHTQIDGATWRTYDRVNERFAQLAAAERPDTSLFWIHDYQLLRVPHHLRRLAPASRIAFFLHIPFPATDVFRVLPWSRSLLRGVLACDLVAFHVPAYAHHFLTCAERLLGCEVDRAAGVAWFEGRAVSVQAHPIGIDVALIESLARGPNGAPRPAAGERVAEILGVDRLDYTKGIHERLLAVERLLERYPAYRRRVRFTQVMVPSRERVAEYSDLKRQIDEAVGRINGRFSEAGWTPVHYLVRSLPPAELVPLYRRADVALLTPLRDGMNLVAKEYAAAQLEDDGVLILSEMAGAADELQEALLVNPFDVEAVADALHRALAMSQDERRARMSALRDRVRANDVHAWVDRFLAAADTAADRAHASVASPADAARRRLAPWLAERPAVALFLDYDGTLTPLVPRPEDATLSDAARATLEQAARTPNLDTVIVSGRALDDVRRLVGIAGLTYVGNHGFEIEGPGLSFRHDRTDRFLAALERAAVDLEALRIPGARVERKGITLSCHLREVPPDERAAAEQAVEAVLRRHRLRVALGHEVLEARPGIDWHKGRAVLHVLVRRHGADWPSRVRALYIGDDVSDEDAFRSLRGIGRSICVTSTHFPTATASDLDLPDPDAVLQLLRWLAAGGFAQPAT